MNQFVELNLDDQRLIIVNTANKKGILNSIVEKDFWVCFVLDYLFSNFKYKDYICFKGGTSLSKVYNLINRFSEDIDLTLDWTLLNYTVDEPYNSRSNRQQDILNKEINSRTGDLLKQEWLSIIKSDFSKLLGDKFDLYIDQSDTQTICFRYPQIFVDKSILQIIRIEIGALAEPIPSSSSELKSYIAQVYPNIISQKNVCVRTVEPIRTFYEKLLILHRESNRTNNQYPQRYSRHYYDVYQMINSRVKEKSFIELDLLRDVVEFKKKVYPSKWANYDGIYLGNIILVPNEKTIKIFEKDYQSMKNMIFGDVPKFSEIINTIGNYELELNNLIKQKFNNL
jgi:predicted nucleotidyltransferase component of viral defense system